MQLPHFKEAEKATGEATLQAPTVLSPSARNLAFTLVSKMVASAAKIYFILESISN